MSYSNKLTKFVFIDEDFPDHIRKCVGPDHWTYDEIMESVLSVRHFIDVIAYSLYKSEFYPYAGKEPRSLHAYDPRKLK